MSSNDFINNFFGGNKKPVRKRQLKPKSKKVGRPPAKKSKVGRPSIKKSRVGKLSTKKSTEKSKIGRPSIKNMDKKIVKKKGINDNESISTKNSAIRKPIKYKDYYFIGIRKTKKTGKKYEAVFHTDTGREKIIPFGNKEEEDYTQSRNKDMKEFYDFKCKNKDKWKDLMSKYALEKYVLWNKPSLKMAVNDYRRRLKGLKK